MEDPFTQIKNHGYYISDIVMVPPKKMAASNFEAAADMSPQKLINVGKSVTERNFEKKQRQFLKSI